MDEHSRRVLFEEHLSDSAADYLDRDNVPDGFDPDAAAPVLDFIWQTWAHLTFTLMTYGIPQRTLCDAAGQIVPAVEQERERQTATG